MTLFKILNVIIEDEHNRTDHEGNINIYWNMAFKCAFSRIFYAAHKSLLGCIKHESDCVAAYTIAAESRDWMEAARPRNRASSHRCRS